MRRIIVFGAGGKAGRAVVGEAVSRGHEVTAVVRDPSKYQDLGVTVVQGDVCDATSVASLAKGHDAAVNAAYDPASAPAGFFVGAANAFLDGLPPAGVKRAVVVGMVSNLEVAPGVRMLDTPEFPGAYLEFAKGHTAGLDTLRTAETELDWVVLTPPMVLDLAERKGTYRTGGDQMLASEDGTSHLSYADLAVAIVDEIETPRHHRARIAVAD